MPDDLASSLDRARALDHPTRKGWTSDTLTRMAVGIDAAGRFLFVIRDAAGEAIGAVRYSDAGQQPKMRADRGTVRDLWPAPEAVPGDVVHVVEGEPDAVSMAQLGRLAVAIPGAGKDNPAWPARIAAGRRRVILWPDADDTGRRRMDKLAKAIAATGVEACILDVDPDGTEGHDVGDVLVALGAERADAVLADAEIFAMPIQPDPATTADGRTVGIIKASDVVMRPVHFLWRPWLPLGKAAVLAGAPGQGKSQLTAFMAAQTTRGWFEPTDVPQPGNVVILTAEDDLADTVVPRLLAAGADLTRVEFVNMRRTMPDGLTIDGLIRLPGDIPSLHARLKAGDVRLVVFDPVASFVGREHSTYVNQDVRDMLDPIVALASRYGVAVVLVLHLNKSEAKTWAQKIGESHAFQAVARTILALAPDPDDEDGESGSDKVLAATKLNLVRGVVPAVKLRVTPVTVYDNDMRPIETSMVALNGTTAILADELLADATDRSARREALDFLLTTLAGGPMESKALRKAAREAGVAWRTLERCYREVCKPAKPATSRGPWVYELQARHIPTYPPGGFGELEDNEGQSPSYPPGVDVGTRLTDPDENGSGELGGHTPADLEAYRRERDRRLGERWDDE